MTDHEIVGLSTDQAKLLQDKFGPNELKEGKRVTIFELIFDQIKNPLILVLISVIVVSVFMQEYSDAIIIGVVIVFNTVVGIIYESKAESAIEGLKQKLALKSKVYRDGVLKMIDASQIVPEDVVVLAAGDKVPADGVLISSTNLQINESQLSGEAFPVIKNNDEKNVFMGSLTVAGKGVYKVTNTGMNTRLGEITSYVNKKNRDITPLEIKFKKLTRNILLVVLIVCLGIIGLGLLMQLDLFEIVETSIALSLSVIPEGLPIVVTLTLAIGVYRMSRKNAVLRNLASVSTLSEVDVICTDKTGTITEGKVELNEVVEVVTESDNEPKLDCIELGILCNDANEDLGDLLDIAILKYGQSQQINIEHLKQVYPRIDEIPFDSKNMFQATLHENNNQYLLVVKGAAEVLINKCNHQQKVVDFIKQKVHEFSENGERVILVASKYIEKNNININDIGELYVSGLLVFTDPIRDEIQLAVQRSKKSNIQTIMITGDHPSTAKSIAIQAGIAKVGEKDVLTGDEVRSFSLDDLGKTLEKITTISRANPMDKVRIVDALKSRGLVVAMTGDGVNDAPALVKADIGIAMGMNGTDAARESADMVLVDDKYSTIINGIEQARLVFENIRKTSSYLFSTSFGEILTITLAIVLCLPLPILAAQILWLNLITDGFLDVAIATEKNHGDLLRFNRKKYKSGVIDKLMMFRILLLGGVMGIGSIIFFQYSLERNTLQYAQTLTFVLLAVYQWINALNSRSQDLSIFQIGFFTNKYVIGAIVIEIILCFFAVYTPLMNNLLQTTPIKIFDWVVIAAIATSIFVVEEIRKLVFAKLSKKLA